MAHQIHQVRAFRIAGPYVLEIQFGDGLSRTINFRPILEGDLFSPLQRLELFNQVALDHEARTLVWPNGADFDPETLHDWPNHEAALVEMAARWARESKTTRRAAG